MCPEAIDDCLPFNGFRNMKEQMEIPDSLGKLLKEDFLFFNML